MNKEKMGIAQELLEQALRLYFEGGADFAALHLAGGAEELLGVQLDELGKTWEGDEHRRPKSAYARHREYIAQISGFLSEDSVTVTADEVGKRLRAGKNAVKHFGAAMPWGITLQPRDEAKDVLYRAVENYCDLFDQFGGLPLTPIIRRFIDEICGDRR